MSRAGSACELCGSQDLVALYEVPFSPDSEADTHIAACQVCRDQLNGESELNADHWRCLNEAVWSPVAPVQVTAWRMLNKLKSDLGAGFAGHCVSGRQCARLGRGRSGGSEPSADSGLQRNRADCR